MTGRFANDVRHAVRKVNARFGSSLRYYVCKFTGRKYISIFATTDIHHREEILPDYGKLVVWHYSSEDESSNGEAPATPTNGVNSSNVIANTSGDDPVSGVAAEASNTSDVENSRHSDGADDVMSTETLPRLSNPGSSDGSSDSEVSDERGSSLARSATTLKACPCCNHTFCGRTEWSSRHAPTLKCGRTITPSGTRYCCRCGDFYRTASTPPRGPTIDAGIPRGANESPDAVSQLGLPPPLSPLVPYSSSSESDPEPDPENESSDLDQHLDAQHPNPVRPPDDAR